MKIVYCPRIKYYPSRDEILLEFSSIMLVKPSKEMGRLKVWWDDKAKIRAIAIASPAKELKEFKKSLKTARLGGIWKGVKITEDDIREVREELWKKLGEKW